MIVIIDLALETANEGLPAVCCPPFRKRGELQLTCEGFIIFARFDNQSLRTSESFRLTLANLRTIVDDLRSQGFTSVRTIAAELEAGRPFTARGGSWHPTSAARLLSRLRA
jgi:hypothetical protein